MGSRHTQHGRKAAREYDDRIPRGWVGRSADLWIVVVLTVMTLASRGMTQGISLPLPVGLQQQEMFVPEDNPLTPAKIALGKQLFFDARCSKGQTVSCASCHIPQHGWGDPRSLSLDHAGMPTRRHAPTVINRVFSAIQGWPGHRESIEALLIQLPFTSPEAIAHNLQPVWAYQEQFRHVFGTEVTATGVARAITAYTRTILSGNSPYDRFEAGDQAALTVEAQRGRLLFEGKARCIKCHSGATFTDESYHNLGVGMDREPADFGRYEITKRDMNKGAFKTPTLRDVARRGPYMHDGSLQTLPDVVEFYNRGGVPNPWLSPDLFPLHRSSLRFETVCVR